MNRISVLVTVVFGLFTTAFGFDLGDSNRLYEKIDFRRPPIVRAPISHIYAPKGFDDNDVAEVVIEGDFENDCYQVERVEPIIDTARKKIQIEVIAVRKALECRYEKSHYMKHVDLRVLPPGKYIVEAGTSLEGSRPKSAILEVKHASSKKRDDFLYAPVNSFILKADQRGGRSITVFGYFNKPCFQFDVFNTKVIPPTDPDPNILVVLPVLVETITNNCPERPTPFSYEINIPDSVPNGRYLIHIRTPQDSFNQIGYVGLVHE